MQLKLYQIDAFASAPFTGNPAAVVPLRQWLPDSTMQAIAQENNLAETAFFVAVGGAYHIRWFTPNAEVRLCGHATLASAYVLFEEMALAAERIEFQSTSGPLAVTRSGAVLTLDFPTQAPVPAAAPEELVRGLGVSPTACLAQEDYLAVFDSEPELAAIEPDFRLLEQLDRRGVIATAPSRQYDFVARFFAPKLAVPEDAVTGSAYTQLTPYWAHRLGKTSLRAKQISARGGEVCCELAGDRVLISGTALKYLEGIITLQTA